MRLQSRRTRTASLLTLIVTSSTQVLAKNRVITVVNNCDYTVWPAIFRSVGPKPSQKTGWEAKPGSRVGFEVEESWGGRVWGRTGCDFSSDKPDYQKCETGGCNGGLECDPDTGTGVLPVTLAEFNIQTEVDHYDTSNVDGFNIPMAVTNDADCPLSNCPYDLRTSCPDDLQYKNSEGKVVGCLTDCGAHQSNEEYCCFGAHQLPEQCPSSAIPNYPWWKKNCPIAYAYDESSGTALFTCTKQVNWQITFCPGPELYSSTALLPNGTEITQGGDYPDYPRGTAKDGGGAPSTVENESGSDSPLASSSGGSSSGGASSGGGGATASSSSASSSGGTGGASTSAAGGGSSSGSSSGSSKTGSTSPSPTGSSSSSAGSTSGSSTSDDTIFGFPSMNVYIALAVAGILVAGAVLFAVMRNKKKHHHRSDSSSGDDGGHSSKKKHRKSSKQDDSDSASEGGSSTQDTESDSSEDDKSSKKHSSRALAKLDSMERAEEMAVNQRLYGEAAVNSAGLRRGRTEERRVFSMSKEYSSDSDSDGCYSSGERRQLTAGRSLARKSLAEV